MGGGGISERRARCAKLHAKLKIRANDSRHVSIFIKRRLSLCLGVARSFARTLPRYIKYRYNVTVPIIGDVDVRSSVTRDMGFHARACLWVKNT